MLGVEDQLEIGMIFFWFLLAIFAGGVGIEELFSNRKKKEDKV